jgi:hypothetical protein
VKGKWSRRSVTKGAHLETKFIQFVEQESRRNKMSVEWFKMPDAINSHPRSQSSLKDWKNILKYAHFLFKTLRLEIDWVWVYGCFRFEIMHRGWCCWTNILRGCSSLLENARVCQRFEGKSEEVPSLPAANQCLHENETIKLILTAFMHDYWLLFAFTNKCF